MCDSGKWETFCERSKKEQSARKISRCARNDSVGNGYPLYHTKSVWEMRSFRIVIPSEAEGSFSLAEEGARPTARNGKHRIAERRWAVLPIKGLAKEEAKGVTKKISRCARNDSVGNGYPVHPAKAVPGKHSSRIVIGSEVCPQSHLSIYFHSTPCISNNYLFFQFGIF